MTGRRPYPRPRLPRPRLREESFSLVEIFDRLIAAAETETLTIDRLLAAFGQRALGVLLLLPCLLILLPVSLIPMVPALAALTMIFIAGHMFFDVRRLWLPRRLARARLPARPVRRALRAARPMAERIDGWMGARLSGFADSWLAAASVALVTLALSLVILVVGFVPGVPALLALAIMVLALGLGLRLLP